MSLAAELKNRMTASLNARLSAISKDTYRILIVDDESSVAGLLCRVLEGAGFKTSRAADGLLALDQVASFAPDLVITDIRMPKLSGVDLVERLQSNGEVIPSIFMTGYTDYESLSRAIKLQPYGFLEKPFSPDKLVALAERAYSDHIRQRQEQMYTDVLYETVQERTQELAFRTERLLAEKELLQGIISSATFGLIAVDANCNVHLLNSYARELTCQLPDSAVPYLGQPLNDLVLPELQSDMKTMFEQCLSSGTTVERKLEVQRTSQRFHVVVYPIIHREAVTAIVFVIHDVTEMEQLQSRLIQAAKLASIGELAAGVAHEINNPLGFVTSNCGTLNRYVKSINEYLTIIHNLLSEPDHSADCASRIDKSRTELDIDYIMEDGGPLIKETMDGLARVSKIVSDLKTFARVDSQEPEMYEVETVLDNALNLCRNETKYKLEIVREYNAGVELSGFPTQLAQVFTNIIVNAAHATMEKGRLIVSTATDDGHVVIEFADTGSGIPEEILPKIFDPFFTTKEPGKGTGMGLSISYGIIKRHGGTITARSKVNEGTTFTIRLPLEASKRPKEAGELEN